METITTTTTTPRHDHHRQESSIKSSNTEEGEQSQQQEQYEDQSHQQGGGPLSLPAAATPASSPPMLGLIPLRSSSSTAAAVAAVSTSINANNTASSNCTTGSGGDRQQQLQDSNNNPSSRNDHDQQQQQQQQQQKQLEVKRFPIVLGRDNLAQWWYQSCNCGNYYCRLHCRPVAQNVGSLSKVMVQIGSDGDVHVVGKNPHLVTIVSNNNNNNNSTCSSNIINPKAAGEIDSKSKSSAETGQQLEDQNSVLRENDILSIGRRDREPWMRFLVVRVQPPVAKRRGVVVAGNPSVSSALSPSSTQKSDLAIKRQQEYDDIVTKLTKAVSDAVAARSAQDPAAAAVAAGEFNTAANNAAQMYQEQTTAAAANDNNNSHLQIEQKGAVNDNNLNIDHNDNRKRSRNEMDGNDVDGSNKRAAVQEGQIDGNNNSSCNKPLSEIPQTENLHHSYHSASKNRSSRRTQIHLVIPDYKKSALLLYSTSRGQPVEWSRPQADTVPVGQLGGALLDPNSSVYQKPKFYSYTANQKYPRKGNFLTAGPPLVNDYPNIPSEDGDGGADNANVCNERSATSQLEPAGNTTTGGDTSDPEQPLNGRNEPPSGRGGGASTNLQFLSQNYAAALLDMKNDEESHSQKIVM